MDIGWITSAHAAQIPVGNPDRVAFSLEGEERVTYAELRARENRYANALLELGVERGDRVGVLLHNCVDYIVLYFAIARIGAIAVRLNTRLTSEELEFALTDSGTSLLCLQPAFLERLEPIRAKLDVAKYVLFGAPPAAGAGWLLDGERFRDRDASEPPVPRPEGGDRLMLMYTSGTTGFPKGSVWTHDTAIGCGAAQALELGYDETSVVMSTGPLYHAGAFESLLLPAMLRQGRGIVTKSGGFDIERVIDVAAAEGVTDLNVYPFMLYDMMRIPGLDAEQLPRLRCLFTGGDPIMTWALEAAQERFPGVKVKQGYGLTESVMATILDHEDGMRHPDSVGRPYPLKEVKVVDDRGEEVGPGEVGEVWIRGAGTTTEYWQRPEETAATFTEGGWLHSGDLGHMSDGLLYLAGRKKDMIRSGGENISAAEVERVLTIHPAIADAAVVAVPDEKYIEVGCAVIVLETGEELADAEVIAHCREHLAGYKCPKHVLRLDRLPRNEGGKVLKAQLRERTRELGSEPVGG
jgi:fatty-acyl-CoA synthase